MSIELTPGESKMVQHAQAKATVLKMMLENIIRDGARSEHLHEVRRSLKEIGGTVEYLIQQKTTETHQL